MEHKTVSTTTKSLKVRHERAMVELERYKILVDTIEDYAIFFIDPVGYIMSWNRGAQKTKGYTEDEIIGEHFSKFYLEDDVIAKKPERELELALKMGRVEDEDWRVRKDGSTFWANVVITALYDSNHNHIGFAKVTRDLTERKIHEDALRKANTQLVSQQQELERLNVSKDEFISLASHQLRTPSTAIKQLLGMLKEGFYGEIPDDIQTVITKAYTSNERLINTVNSLLRVAQLDAGKVILKKVPVNMGQLLHDIYEEQADTIKSRNQEFKLSLPVKQTVHMEADYDNLRMAISNLLDNATKYTSEGGKIVVSLKREAKKITICVQDNGVGIKKQDINKLFEKFVRIPNELSQKVGGSGLGLYWVRKIIELHGGKIKVASDKKNGTQFTIIFPVDSSYA
ncbi:MAG TPA: PAS domain-containing sensor histidine kinase [Candidatus Saccharimonadales bacterium]|nr:PAS domain-containing sensor histidine kinase [Candidatus Saccharimonadales bacterium]